MRILVATDAWRPQINGVVRTYERLDEELRQVGVELAFMTPGEFSTLPCPTYPEVRLAIPGFTYVIERLACAKPDAVHIATEGPIGWMTRKWCLTRGIPFITAYHTRFPEYLEHRFCLPLNWSYKCMRLFHNSAAATMVASPSLARELERRGFERLMPWTRGVDTQFFHPRDVRLFGSDKPVFLYVGRVAVEKNLDAFLRLDLPGLKVVVGTGPMLEKLSARYPDVVFTGKKVGEELAQCYASADVFVFPSLTDTFGIVLLEAMATGLPVAAFPVTGPIDNVIPGKTGVLDEDLRKACIAALDVDRAGVRAHAMSCDWGAAARMFLTNVESALFANQGRRVPARRPLLSRRGQATSNPARN
jgi:glycosyltransferase involved in cell wall biosynthesis